MLTTTRRWWGFKKLDCLSLGSRDRRWRYVSARLGPSSGATDLRWGCGSSDSCLSPCVLSRPPLFCDCLVLVSAFYMFAFLCSLFMFAFSVRFFCAFQLCCLVVPRLCFCCFLCDNYPLFCQFVPFTNCCCVLFIPPGCSLTSCPGRFQVSNFRLFQIPGRYVLGFFRFQVSVLSFPSFFPFSFSFLYFLFPLFFPLSRLTFDLLLPLFLSLVLRPFLASYCASVLL